ncbi:MAG: glycosyltransferase family 2 protein [Thermoguttaceae bacterium]|nr:glycosyltransferase family 2 protein [Thermoguttaceae bacterium]
MSEIKNFSPEPSRLGDFSPSRKAILSVVVPAFNEELNLEKLYEVVGGYLDQLESYDWEMIVVDDGSRDQTADVLSKLHELDARVKMVSFSRNFGNQMAISAGLEAATGDVVIVMDADLQQPPELISVLLARWEAGYHVVNTRKVYGKNVGWFKRTTSEAFYRVMDMLSDVRIERGVSDFRLMDRKVVNVLNNMPEHSRFIRAQVAWLGFRQTTVPFTANKRNAGVPSFSFYKLVSLAMDGIISSSARPLRLITLSGILLFSLLIPYGCWALFQFCFLGAKTPGWTSLVMIELFMGGTMLVSLGIIGEYVARIYEEVKHRPRYIVDRALGFSIDEKANGVRNLPAHSDPTDHSVHPDQTDHTDQRDESVRTDQANQLEVLPFSNAKNRKSA